MAKRTGVHHHLIGTADCSTIVKCLKNKGGDTARKAMDTWASGTTMTVFLADDDDSIWIELVPVTRSAAKSAKAGGK